MNLRSDLDLKQIATDAGLDPQQVEHFAQGLEGNRTDTIGLAREPYTQLQKTFEEALVAVFSDQLDFVFPSQGSHLQPPLLYRTPKLVTPVHNPDHPRADVMQAMLNTRVPLAALLCNYEGVQAVGSMDHLQVATTRERLRNILSQKRDVDPFSVNPQGEPTGHTFMAMRSLGRLSAIQFEASQMPDLMNKEPGKVIFGEEAQAAYEDGKFQHLRNLMEERGSKSVQEILFK